MLYIVTHFDAFTQDDDAEEDENADEEAPTGDIDTAAT